MRGPEDAKRFPGFCDFGTRRRLRHLDPAQQRELGAATWHGGHAADWVKKSSSSHTARDGVTFETHWVENVRTGQHVEFKTKFPGGD